MANIPVNSEQMGSENFSPYRQDGKLVRRLPMAVVVLLLYKSANTNCLKVRLRLRSNGCDATNRESHCEGVGR